MVASLPWPESVCCWLPCPVCCCESAGCSLSLLGPLPAPPSLPATDCPPPAEPEISCRSRDGGAAQRPTLPPVAGTEASGGDRCVCPLLLHFSISFLSTDVCHCLPETYLSNLYKVNVYNYFFKTSSDSSIGSPVHHLL